jgi:hypothetical protein
VETPLRLPLPFLLPLLRPLVRKRLGVAKARVRTKVPLLLSTTEKGKGTTKEKEKGRGSMSVLEKGRASTRIRTP